VVTWRGHTASGEFSLEHQYMVEVQVQVQVQVEGFVIRMVTSLDVQIESPPEFSPQ
jgi:hypothetical protein